jgi:hypothetical protein
MLSTCPHGVAVRVFHDVTADDFGVALVPWPVELGDEIAVEGHPWPLEVVDLVGARGSAGRGDREGACCRPPQRLTARSTTPELVACSMGEGGRSCT